MTDEGQTAGPSWLSLLVFLIICYAVAAFGALFAPGPWYDFLDKPAWTPPPAVFPPVWSFLYATLAVSAYLIWLTGAGAARRTAMALFALQLACNGIWPWIFFGRHLIGWALADLLLLVLLVVATVWMFARLRRVAAVLLLPYLAWISFAAALNAAILIRNPGV